MPPKNQTGIELRFKNSFVVGNCWAPLQLGLHTKGAIQWSHEDAIESWSHMPYDTV